MGDAEYRIALLQSLTKKDYRDVKKSVLDEHIMMAMEYCQEYPREIFVPYVLCPRVWNETLTEYRVAIQNFFSEKEKRVS